MAEPMLDVSTAPFACPGCEAELNAPQGRVQCPSCQWVGDLYAFSPRAQDVEDAEMALPEDAACLHHPRKKAVAVCAGTGDYICSLCSVELNGQTYSAEYLNNAGKEVAGKAFEKMLVRPDSRIMTYLLCSFVPYVNFIFLPFAFLWIPHSVILFSRMRRLRREDEIYARLVGKGRMITIAVLLILFSLAWTAGLTAVVFAIISKHNHG